MNSIIHYIHSLPHQAFMGIAIILTVLDVATLITDISEFASAASNWFYHRDTYNIGHNLGKLIKVGLQILMIANVI